MIERLLVWTISAAALASIIVPVYGFIVVRFWALQAALSAAAIH
jgi:uncharacterized membrane protein YwzB